MSSLARFIGIPYEPHGRGYDGADCWGICLLYARDGLGIELPEFFYPEGELLDRAALLIDEETSGPRWRRSHAPHLPGTIHVLRIKGAVTHCGISVSGSLFLHSLPGRNSCIESLDAPDWIHRNAGSYRLCGMTSR